MKGWSRSPATSDCAESCTADPADLQAEGGWFRPLWVRSAAYSVWFLHVGWLGPQLLEHHSFAAAKCKVYWRAENDNSGSGVLPSVQVCIEGARIPQGDWTCVFLQVKFVEAFGFNEC